MGWDTVTGTYTPDNLIVNTIPTISYTITILSGENLSRGCVVGSQTSGGKYIACDHTAVDGSEDPVAVLMEDCDATGGDVDCGVYVFGHFNSDALTFGGSSTIADLKHAMRLNGLYVSDANN